MSLNQWVRTLPSMFLFWAAVLFAFTAGAVTASLINQGLTWIFPEVSIYYDISRGHPFFLPPADRIILGWIIGGVFALFLTQWLWEQEHKG